MLYKKLYTANQTYLHSSIETFKKQCIYGCAKHLQIQQSCGFGQSHSILALCVLPGYTTHISKSETDKTHCSSIVTVDSRADSRAVCAEMRMKMKDITADMTIGEALNVNPDIVPVLMQIGMHCIGCPASMGETIEEAAMVHGIDVNELLDHINMANDEKEDKD